MIAISKENFITDDKTNIVCCSSLLPSDSSGLSNQLGKELYNALVNFARTFKHYDLYNTKDIWARDYMPVQLTQELFLNYTYSPDYLCNQKKYITNWQLHNVHDTNKKLNVETSLTIPLVIDGGNLVKAIDKYGKPTIIMCSKVLDENNVTQKDLLDWWNPFFDNQINLILIKWEGEDENPIGHADGMVRYISEGKVLITNYCDLNDEERLTEPLKDFFDIERLHFGDIEGFKDSKMWSLMKSKSWGYINFLQVGRHIMVPSLGWDKLDKAALQQIKNAYGTYFEVETISCDMTQIFEDMNVNVNSGGGLNCLTWTLYKKNN